MRLAYKITFMIVLCMLCVLTSHSRIPFELPKQVDSIELTYIWPTERISVCIDKKSLSKDSYHMTYWDHRFTFCYNDSTFSPIPSHMLDSALTIIDKFYLSKTEKFYYSRKRSPEITFIDYSRPYRLLIHDKNKRFIEAIELMPPYLGPSEDGWIYEYKEDFYKLCDLTNRI